MRLLYFPSTAFSSDLRFTIVSVFEVDPSDSRELLKARESGVWYFFQKLDAAAILSASLQIHFALLL